MKLIQFVLNQPLKNVNSSLRILMPFVGMEPSKTKLPTKYLVLRVCLWPSFYVEISGAGSKLSMSKGSKKHCLHVLIIESPNLIIKFLFVDPESRPAALKSQKKHITCYMSYHLLSLVCLSLFAELRSKCY